MEIIADRHYSELLDFLPSIKSSLPEWQLVEISLLDNKNENFTSRNISELIFSAFKNKEGQIYIVGKSDVLMLVRNGKDTDPVALSHLITSVLPEDGCEIQVYKPTEDAISKLKLFIRAPKTSFAQRRYARKENVALVADDDSYMRSLVKTGMRSVCTIQEVTEGNNVIGEYKKHCPDIVFLDIHMPEKDGMANLHDILSLDPDAFVVMLSADSSQENVQFTMKKGAKGFLTKPFNKERLLEYIKKCPTIN